jgi:hypothetical protein
MTTTVWIDPELPELIESQKKEKPGVPLSHTLKAINKNINTIMAMSFEVLLGTVESACGLKL